MDNKYLKMFLSIALSCSILPSFNVKANDTDNVEISNYKNSLTGSKTVKAPEKRGAVPSTEQMQYYKDELAAFIHFGPNTFTGREWGHGTAEEIKSFDPTELNTDQWVQTLKAAGFKKIIVTAKHHDGFQLWPSAYSEKNVKNSKFAEKVGKENVDVLAKLSASCTKLGVDMGLYLSPWDMSEDSYGQHVRVLKDDGSVVMEIDENGKVIPGTDHSDGIGDFWGKIEVVKEDKNGDYNQFYLNQLKEILENPKYGRDGHFTEIWMDGAKNDTRFQKYDLHAWWDLCRELEPGVLVFNNIGNDVRWVGNESGHSYDPIWAQVDSNKLWNDYNLGIGAQPNKEYPSRLRIVNKTDHRTGENRKTWAYVNSYEDGTYLTKGDPNGNLWSMPESDSSIIGDWFWKNKAPQTGKELAEKYFKSVGNATPMLLNTPPNKKGLLEDSYEKSLKEFRSILNNTFKNNVALNAEAVATSTYKNSPTYAASNVTNGKYDSYWAAEEGKTDNQTVTLYLDGAKQFDLIDIKEYIPLGQNVSNYEVEVRVNGVWKSFGKTGNTQKSKQTIGYRSILRDNPVDADAIRLTIKNSYGSAKISEIGAYKMDSRIEYSKASTSIPEGIQNSFIDSHSATRSGNWDLNDADTARINSMLTWDANASATYTFTGTRFFLSSRYSPNFGAMLVKVDDGDEFKVNLNDPTPTISSIVYASDTLPMGKHTVRIRPTSANGKNTIATDGLYYLNNDAKGMFEIANTNIEVTESDTAKLMIKRIGGSKGKVSIQVNTEPGTAVNGRHYDTVDKVVIFNDGETEKEVFLPTIDNEETTGTLEYRVKISSPTNGSVVGFNNSATVNIIDNEVNTSALNKALQDAKSLDSTKYANDVWNQLQMMIQNAEEFLQTKNLSQKQVDNYLTKFNEEMKYIREKGSYVDINLNGETSIEAEDCELNNGAAVFDKNDASAWSGLSGKGMVGNIYGQGNLVSWVNFPKAGTYTVKVQYYAGDINQIYFDNGQTGENAIVATKDVIKGTPSSVEIKINVNKPGIQALKFYKNASCTKDHPNLDKFTFKFETVATTDINVDVENLHMNQGETKQIHISFKPSNASNRNLVYTSLNKDIVSVTENGLIKGIKAGETTIKVQVKGTNIVKEIKVVVNADKTKLAKRYEEVRKLKQEMYTTTTWKEVDKALANAKNILSDKNVKQEQIDQSLQQLNNAVAQLKERANTEHATKVLEEINDKKLVQEQYTETSWQAFEEAKQELENAIEDNKDVNEEQMLTYIENAKNACNRLAYKQADYSKVDAAIEKAEKLNKADYKDFSKVETAIKAVVRNKNITEQKEVDAMAQAIEDAIKALEKKSTQPLVPLEPSKPITPWIPLEPSKPIAKPEGTPMVSLEPSKPIVKPGEKPVKPDEKPNTDKNSVNTGYDTKVGMLWILVMVGAVNVLIVDRKRKLMK